MDILPKLLFVSDVPIEETSSGSLHLYRLLRNYPSDRLRVAESSYASSGSNQEDRLPGVRYTTFSFGNSRWSRSRLRRWHGSLLHLSARWREHAEIERIVEAWTPDAILTLWHGYSWLHAANTARSHNLPLHLIVHDDIPNYKGRAHPLFDKLYHRDFRQVYRQAAFRLCVSPYMEETYRERYGASGTVMYPMRNWGAPQYDAPPDKVRESSSNFVVAYSGSLHTMGFREMLHDVAEIVEELGGHLLVFSHIDPESARGEHWVRPSMNLRSFVPQEKIIPTLRQEADALFLPMAFKEKPRVLSRTNFPSKLAEYTATGLPLLVWGPEETSGVRWARSNPGVAEVVTSPESDTVRPALQRLVNDPDHRFKIGKKALEIGEEYFAPEVAWSTFYEAISQKSNVEKPSTLREV